VGRRSATSFRVAARAGEDHYGGQATLLVTAEGLILRPGFLLSRASGLAAVVHRAREVRVIRSRLPLPWAWATVVVDSGPVTAVASVGPLVWRRLRWALDHEGYLPRVERAWVGRGGDLLRGGLTAPHGSPRDR
jgi:hypothetical protein